MKQWAANANNPHKDLVTDNPYLRKAVRREWRSPWYPAQLRVKQTPRRYYRPYLPRIQRVTWKHSMIDDTSIHGSIRLFGWLRKERLWFLVETTGVEFMAALERGMHDRRGIEVTWLRSPDMRLHLLKLAAATRNTLTQRFVDDSLATMDRINRVKHKFNSGESQHENSVIYQGT